MKNRYIKLHEKIKNEKLILESLNYFHRHHIQSASKLRAIYREDFESLFSETEERFANLIQLHETKFIKLTKKLTRRTK